MTSIAAAVGDGFYDRVETRDVAATREDADSFFHHRTPYFANSQEVLCWHLVRGI